MNNFNLSENQKFMVGIGWIEFNPISNRAALKKCDMCCLRNTGRCYDVKCCPVERLDACHGYFTIIPKRRVKTAKKVLHWFGL